MRLSQALGNTNIGKGTKIIQDTSQDQLQTASRNYADFAANKINNTSQQKI